ncbi:MAG: TetR/AcrR family transcriptional regulator [Thermoanaerobaculia bacterium]
MVQKLQERPPAPDAKTLRRKREILEAASRVFRRRGLHATGMRDIAAELEMHVGNLYYYFRNKEDLLAFCQEDALAGLLDLAGHVRATGLRADAKLYRLIVGHVIRVNDETPGALAHLEVDALTGDRRQTVLRQRDAYETAYRQLITDGIDQGVFRQVDAAVVAMATLGALNWTVKWYRQDGRKSSHDIGHDIADLLVRGLLAPGVELAAEAVDG